MFSMSNCLLCHSHHLRYVVRYRCTHRPSRQLFRKRAILRCLRCGMMQIDPVPTAEQVRDYYSKPYRQGGFNARASLEHFPVDNLWYLSRGRALRQMAVRHVPAFAERPLRILEIGSGFGHVLWAFKEANESCQLFACEPDQRCRPFLRKCNATVFQSFVDPQESLDELMVSEGPFDLAVLSHVLEHPVSPVAFLSLMASLLGEDGHMLIEVPHTPLDETRWTPNHAPHVSFFVKESLRACLEHAGGTVDFIDTCGSILSSCRSLWYRCFVRAARRVVPHSLRSAVGGKYDSMNVSPDILTMSDVLPLPEFGMYGGDTRAFLRAVVRF